MNPRPFALPTLTSATAPVPGRGRALSMAWLVLTIVEAAGAGRNAPGDAAHALAGHACTTAALHREVRVTGVGRWPVAARDRGLAT